MSGPLADVRVQHEPAGRVVVSISGEIDMANVTTVRDEIDRALPEASATMALDLSGVEYIDTQGVRLVVELAARPELALTIVAPPGGVVAEVLAITDLASHLDVRPQLDP